MHILLLTVHDIVKPKYGGALRDARLFEYLLNKGVEISVIRFRKRGEPPLIINKNILYDEITLPFGYPLAPLAFLAHTFSCKAEKIGLAFHKKSNIDLIESGTPWVSLTGIKLANKLKVPHVILSQNCESHLAKEISLGSFLRRFLFLGNALADINVSILHWAEKLSISHADLILTPSEVDREEMAHWGIPISKVEVLPNGTNIKKETLIVRQETRDILGISEETSLVIFVGRLDYPPNTEAVNIIARCIAPKCPDCIFLIIGSNPPLNSQKNIRFLGFVDRIDNYLCAGDLALAPITFGSGTRIKILDSWAAGLPVLATSTAASGLNYEPERNIIIEDDLTKYPERIRELLAEPSRMEILHEGALEAVKPYFWEVIGENYFVRLKKLLER